MAAVVVTTGVDAAADVQIDFTEVKQFVEVLVALRDGRGNGERACIGQVAVVAAWAGNHVGQHADIGFGQTQGLGFLVKGWQLFSCNPWQYQVLVMADTGFAS